MTTNNETIAEIVSDMRVYAKNSKVNGGEVDVWNWLANYADRIEAAHKRERKAGAEAAQICGEIGEMIGREAAGRQPVTDCNRLGNAAKDDKRLTIVAMYENVIADKDAVIAELKDCILKEIDWLKRMIRDDLEGWATSMWSPSDEFRKHTFSRLIEDNTYHIERMKKALKGSNNATK